MLARPYLVSIGILRADLAKHSEFPTENPLDIQVCKPTDTLVSSSGLVRVAQMTAFSKQVMRV